MADLVLEPLPEGTRLVHIGAHKTGTSSVQGAFHDQRAELQAAGVQYPGTDVNHALAFRALFGWASVETQTAGQHRLGDLRAALAADTTSRVLLSSEELTWSDLDEVRRVRELVGPRSHVVLTLRDMGGFLPSMWQQAVRNGEPTPFDDWLAARLRRPERVRTFHRADDTWLTHRWARVFGAEHVTVVVLQRSAPERLFSVFEQLLAIPAGTLAVSERNRGMTLPESELVRQLNVRTRRLRVPAARRRALVYRGAVTPMLHGWEPPPGTVRPTIPAPLVAGVAALGRQVADEVRASGVRVVGSLDELARVPADPPASNTTTSVPLDVATIALAGLLERAEELVAEAQAGTQRRHRLDGVNLVPAPGRLVHVGPPHTGGPRLRAAFAASADALRAHGVDLSPDAPAAGRRTFVSDDAWALDPGAVSDSDLRDARVLVTLRPLGDVLLGCYADHLLAGGTQTLRSWLTAALAAGGPGRVPLAAPDREDLLGVWTRRVGVEGVTVLVPRPSDGALLVDAPVRMLDLPTRLVRAGRVVRAMSDREAAVLRLRNTGALGRRASGLTPAQVRTALSRWSTGPDEPALGVPEDLQPQVAELAELLVARVTASGVAVVGGLGTVLRPPRTAADDDVVDASAPRLVGAARALRSTLTPKEDDA
ncbi:hypothetical protein [Cellulomonas sp. PSBB021]|uniref:hypothetical protein n=1 Tax=Cellulomonas sp. PSBB021 TaxID=2003551 RepID=UPI000B8D6DAD|nr:hypothetical protein [Cellulomonas sp. PSBB021]ASR55051.1 hypothetical protein CBP52_08055 [Cellulomonas sp. PSBB021]